MKLILQTVPALLQRSPCFRSIHSLIVYVFNLFFA